MNADTVGEDGAARRRVWILVVAMYGIAVVPTAALARATPTRDELATGLVVLVAVAATERWSLTARIGQYSQRLTLSEIPLLVGLFTLPPVLLVTARVVGGWVALRILRRQEARKAAYNIGYLWLETLLALALLQGLDPTSVTDGIRSVPVTVGLAVLMTATGAMAMTGVLSALQGRLVVEGVPRHLVESFPSSLATSAAALIGLVLFAADPLLLWAPVVIVAVLALAYRSHLRLLETRNLQARLAELTTDVTGDTTVERTAVQLAEATRRLTAAAIAGVRLPDTGGGAAGWFGVAPTGSTALEHAVGLQDGTHDPEDGCGVDATTVVAAPIGSMPGAWIAIRYEERQQVAASDAQALHMIANHAVVALANAARRTELRVQADEARRRANQDPLTGLPNRTALLGEVEEAIGGEDRFAMLLVDLDNFKEINDALGHGAGDAVLIALASRCAPLADETITFARLGGDEFAALMLGGEAQARDLAARLHRELRRPIQVGPYTLEVGASIGIALHPDHGGDAGELLKNADLAMYDAKGRGGGVEVFGAAAGGRAMRQLALSTGVRRALSEDLIDVVYQPIVDLRTGRPVSVEALARWTDPTLGPIPPAEFIPVVEQSGLIIDLTARMLDRALSQQREWASQGTDLRVSVNFSARALTQSGIARLVAEALDTHRVPGERLTVELTESMILSDPQRTLPTLERLADIGVRLSIDDFGTGYSSLAYLREMPVDEVKVDKSFILPMDTDRVASSLVAGIVRLCHEMGFVVVAEGVETTSTRKALRGFGCDRGQGFGIARPMPAEHVVPWVSRQLEGTGTGTLRVVGDDT